MRALLLVALLANGCGALLDVGYHLLDDGRYTETVDQSRPTGQIRTIVEHDVVVTPEQKLRLVCEERTRSIVRAWKVDKEYEYRGGYPQAHLIPIILEGAIAGGVALGVAIRCNQADSDLSCDPVYYTIPFGVDLAYSVYRVLTIGRPKLVNKTYGTPHPRLADVPSESKPVACEPNAALVLGTSSQDPLALQLPVAADGTLDDEGQKRAAIYLAERPAARPVRDDDPDRTLPAFDRCRFLLAHRADLTPEQSTAVGVQCAPPPPAR